MTQYFDIIGGYKLPQVGFGTFTVTDEIQLENSLDVALEAGYRHIDTAYLYQNEHIIGKVLKKWFNSGKLKREDIFITTKLPGCQPPEKVEKCLKESLEKLQLDYVDLYLIHFPLYLENFATGEPGKPLEVLPTSHLATWKKMEEQIDQGRTKTIGVSNFNIKQLKRVVENAKIKPASNQFELHVYLQQPELVKYCLENEIVPVSYQSLGNPGLGKFFVENNFPVPTIPNLLGDPVVNQIADKHKKTAGQVLLKFWIQKNVAVIPKSVTPSRIKENISLFDFTLDSDDMKALEALDKGDAGRISKLDITKEMVADPEYPFPRN